MVLSQSLIATLAGAVAVLMVKSSVVLLVAWAAARLASGVSAAVRHGTWSLALLGVLLLPFFEAGLPSFRITLPFQLPSVRGDAVAVATPATVSQALAVGAEVPDQPASGGVGANAVVTTTFGESIPHAPQRRWVTLLLFTWSVGVLLRLVRLRGYAGRAARLARATDLPIDPDDQALVMRLANGIGIRRQVRLLRSSTVTMPVAWGVFRPVVLVPAAAESWSRERLEMVLLHELAHVRRFDYLTSLIAEVACALYWPVPFVWIARGRLRDEQEKACDDQVLGTGARPIEYADHLLAVARAFYVSDAPEPELGLSMAREIGLKQRVRAILDDRRDRRPMRCLPGVAAAVVILGTVPPIAAISGVVEAPAEAQDPDAEPVIAESAHLPFHPLVEPTEPRRPPTRIWIEAEAGESGGTALVMQDLSASGEKYVTLLHDGGEVEPGRLEYRLNVPENGEYRIWLRIASNGEPIAVSIDGGPVWTWAPSDLEISPDWVWVPLRPVRGSGEVGGFDLPAGRRAIRVLAAGGPARLDRILVTDDLTFVPRDHGPSAPVIPPIYRLIEAEDAGLDGRALVREEDFASNGSYVRFADANGRREAGSATFSFDLAHSGRYIVWGRVFAPDNRSNSLFVSVNDGREFIWDTPDRSVSPDDRGWAWDPLSSRSEDVVIDPLILDLSAGPNVVKVRTREEDVRLDALLITNDLTHRPRGIWPESLPIAPVHLSIEAEEAVIEPPLTIRSISDASGGRAVAVADLTDGPAEPGAAGIVRFHVIVPESGLYSIWGRVLPSGDRNNSFWVRVNGGEWIRWNGIPDVGFWIWSAVHYAEDPERIAQFDLEPGEHVIEFAGREANVMLDRVLITNDPLVGPDRIP